ncbi:MAG TPA: DUF4339 domain-containing protein [Rhizomicrobium sp.]|jgi:hypothetical protein
MSSTWTISVGDRAYGPYTLEQMIAFQSEGRLAPHSMVAREGEEQFHHASEDAQLSQLFPSVAASTPAAQPAASPAVQHADVPTATARFGRDARAAPPGERNRYIVLSDMKSGSISALEEEIFNFGLAYRFLPQAWILTSEVSLNTIRSELIQKLGKLDILIVVDTSNDKAAWFNFGPEADAKMRRLWQREAAPARSA